jgi:uncharacterized repeat protein (TIGR03803 family)
MGKEGCVDPRQWLEVERIYHAALEQEPAAREAYLDESCGDDSQLRREVEELIAYQERAANFIETPAVEMMARRAAAASERGFRLAAGGRLGPYEILQPVDAGGQGEVYRARDTRLGRVVALKILGARMLEPSGLRRLEREARAISSLNHPHICTLFDIGRDADIDYLVMEYVEGRTLAARLCDGRMALPEVLRIACQIAEALDYAHRQGIVHRDLKPGNIMLTEGGAKLVDFGLARWLQQTDDCGSAAPMGVTASLSLTGVVLGTPQYMAPEQIAGGEVDARTDVFAFGAVLFEMAHGRKAFADGTKRQAVRAGSRGATSRAALDRVILRCLRNAPEERWSSAAELLRELRRVEARKQPRRLAWAAIVGLLSIVAAISGMLVTKRPAAPRLKPEILYSFTGKNGDGAILDRCGVTIGPDGAFYGFTFRGGTLGHGTVYRLSRRSGGWHEEVIYTFIGPNGRMPVGAPVFGPDGSLYGAASVGGAEDHGLIFRLKPPAAPGGAWTGLAIHQFTPSRGDGADPAEGPIFGSDGSLYGTTRYGGPHTNEIVYELLPPAGSEGEWKERVIHRFTGSATGDEHPWGGVVFGKDGNLYGTAFGRPGLVYQLRPPANPGREWDEKLLYHFLMNDASGDSPVTGLTVGGHGELYGTTQWGGINASGTVFEMSPSGSGGGWTHSVLHWFASQAGDGTEPISGVLVGPHGELYGTTQKGGAWGRGTIFKLTPPARGDGSWTETVLYEFTGQNGDGGQPHSNPHLIFDKTGGLVGTTVSGGAFGGGTVFRLPL